ncbi:MAG: hypothetical protein HYV07_13710 [Deltaproteobacteria bacterium]|nr:hypothetical protein [Deltaproteobacteria bacterium]
MKETPYGTPRVLPVDAEYCLTTRTRSELRERARAHGFDLRAPTPTLELEGSYSRSSIGPRVERHRLRFRRPVRLAPRATALLESHGKPAGLIGSHVECRGSARVLVEGESAVGSSSRAWMFRLPLQGELCVRAGPSGAMLREISLFTCDPGVVETIDRYPLHRALRVGRELRLSFTSLRTGQNIEQLTLHWGAVEYRYPDRSRPLVAWGYPYYLDGVLGDVELRRSGRVTARVEGKFLELDEVENLLFDPPVPADSMTLVLRARDPRGPPPPECRVAAVEVRYSSPVKPFAIVKLARRIRAGEAAELSLSELSGVRRLDLLWSDRGPAMASIEALGRTSRFHNVNSGEAKPFTYFHGATLPSFRVRAKLAGLRLHELRVFGGLLD